MVSISTLLMRLGFPSFSKELAQHIRLCGKDKVAIEHAKMILGVAEEQDPSAEAAPALQGAARMTEAVTSTQGAARMSEFPAASQGAAMMSEDSAASSSSDRHRLKFGVDTPPALFGSTDIRYRQEEGEWLEELCFVIKTPFLSGYSTGGALPKLRRPKRKKISKKALEEAVEKYENSRGRRLEPLVSVSIANGGARALLDITEGVKRMSVDPAPAQSKSKRRAAEFQEQRDSSAARDKVLRDWQRAKQEG